MRTLNALKRLAAKLTGKSVNEITGDTVDEVIEYAQANYSGGGGIPEIEIDYEISQDRQTVTCSGEIPTESVFVASLPVKQSPEGWTDGYKYVALAGANGSGSDVWTYIDPVDGGIYAIQSNMGSLYSISRLNN